MEDASPKVLITSSQEIYDTTRQSPPQDSYNFQTDFKRHERFTSVKSHKMSIKVTEYHSKFFRVMKSHEKSKSKSQNVS